MVFFETAMYKIRKALSKTESWSKIREETVKRSRGLTDNRGIQMNQAQKTLLALLKHALREERYEDAIRAIYAFRQGRKKKEV